MEVIIKHADGVTKWNENVSKLFNQKVGIVVTCFNRSEYTKQFFRSFKEATLPLNCLIVLIDDCSTEQKAIDIFTEFESDKATSTEASPVKLIKERNKVNKGIRESLKWGFDKCFEEGCEIVMNFDNDSIIKPYAITKLVDSLENPEIHIVTGFNCNSKNKDGSYIHPFVMEGMFPAGQKFTFRKSVGGINMCFKKETYEKYIKPALEVNGNWDHNACIASMKDNKPICCLRPSVVQHIGKVSSLNHSNSGDVDFADDYNLYEELLGKKDLSQVTLLGIDCIEWQRLETAILQCTKQIKFGEIKMLTSTTHTHPIWNHGQTEVRHWVNIPHIASKYEYSKFIMKELYKYVDTPYVLLIQWDGYVLDASKWKEEWLQYDYIGASWAGYFDGHRVGNGGFSLRSQKLLKILAEDEHITAIHPEDFNICRTYRKYLEDKYAIKFAPIEVADQFSIEAYGSSVLPDGNKYAGQFGFHGFNVNYEGSHLSHVPSKPIVHQQYRNPYLRR